MQRINAQMYAEFYLDQNDFPLLRTEPHISNIFKGQSCLKVGSNQLDLLINLLYASYERYPSSIGMGFSGIYTSFSINVNSHVLEIILYDVGHFDQLRKAAEKFRETWKGLFMDQTSDVICEMHEENWNAMIMTYDSEMLQSWFEKAKGPFNCGNKIDFLRELDSYLDAHASMLNKIMADTALTDTIKNSMLSHLSTNYRISH